MGYPGLEPGTCRLKAEYSTIELVTQFKFFLIFIIKNLVYQKISADIA